MMFAMPHAMSDQLPIVWVPNWSSMSCDLGTFMDQPAEPVATSKAKVGL